jgi:hypothetical protein
MQKRPMRDVIVLLPGITGSVLRKDGRDVWAPTAGAVTDALFSLGPVPLVDLTGMLRSFTSI